PSRGGRQVIIKGQGASAIRRGRSNDAIRSRRISARLMEDLSTCRVARQAPVSGSASAAAILFICGPFRRVCIEEKLLLLRLFLRRKVRSLWKYYKRS